MPICMAIGDITGMRELAAQFARLERAAPQCAARALERCGLIAVREAKANAPRSPTMKILSATLKKKKRTARRTFPGGLEKSITYEVTGGAASVFVASNSYAGKYARRIHDEKFVTWKNRGAGTIAKGNRADEKFIERAVNDNQGKFRLIFEDEIRKGLANA